MPIWCVLWSTSLVFQPPIQPREVPGLIRVSEHGLEPQVKLVSSDVAGSGYLGYSLAIN